MKKLELSVKIDGEEYASELGFPKDSEHENDIMMIKVLCRTIEKLILDTYCEDYGIDRKQKQEILN